MPRIVISGTGAVCAAGKHPEDIFAAVRDGRSALTEIRQWDASGWPTQVAAAIADFNARDRRSAGRRAEFAVPAAGRFL